MDDVLDGEAVPEPRSSVEKVRAELQRMATEPMPGVLGLMKAILPMATIALPSDPDELDAMLIVAARMALELRSDDAWQPREIVDLYVAPDADASPVDQLAETPAELEA